VFVEFLTLWALSKLGVDNTLVLLSTTVELPQTSISAFGTNLAAYTDNTPLTIGLECYHKLN